jgi:hypothetical protein
MDPFRKIIDGSLLKNSRWILFYLWFYFNLLKVPHVFFLYQSKYLELILTKICCDPFATINLLSRFTTKPLWDPFQLKIPGVYCIPSN